MTLNDHKIFMEHRTSSLQQLSFLYAFGYEQQLQYDEFICSLLIHQDRLDAGMNTSIHQMAKDRQTPHHGIVGRSHRIVRQKQGICNLLVFYVPFAVLWA